MRKFSLPIIMPSPVLCRNNPIYVATVAKGDMGFFTNFQIEICSNNQLLF